MLANQSMALNSGVQIRNTLIVPDTLTLSEALESFKTAGEDFAVIMNEYALVVGIITLNDVMTTLMGDLVGRGLEEQIVARDENSGWLTAARRLTTSCACWISMSFRNPATMKPLAAL